MFAIPGIVALLVQAYLRPQEYFLQLQSVPLLYLFLGLALFGLAVDLKLRQTQPIASPLLGWLLAFVGWSLFTLALRLPSGLQTAVTDFDRSPSPSSSCSRKACSASARCPSSLVTVLADRALPRVRRRASRRGALRLLQARSRTRKIPAASGTAAPASKELDCTRRRAPSPTPTMCASAWAARHVVGRRRPRALSRRAQRSATSWRSRSASRCRSPSPSSSANAPAAGSCSWV